MILTIHARPCLPRLHPAQLPPAAFGGMLASIRALSAPGSSLAFDFIRLDALSGRAFTGGLEVMALGVAARGEPFLSAVDDSPAAVAGLAKMFGFRCRQRLGARGLARRFLPHLTGHSWWPEVQPCFAFAEFAVGA